MKELTFDQVEMVSGGITVTESTALGGGAGSSLGIIVSNTAAGTGRGGAVGAALGFAFGVGFAAGTSLYKGVTKIVIKRKP